jgi:PAS domain S-box-containing protein
MENDNRHRQSEAGRSSPDAGHGVSQRVRPVRAGRSEEPHDEYLQQALRQAQDNLLRYRELFDYAPDGYVVTDLKGIIQEANHAAAAMLGTRKEFLVNKPLLFYIARNDRRAFAANLNQLSLQSGGRLQWELRLCPSGTAPVYVIVTVASAPTDEHAAELRWIFRDISQRRLAEETLRAEKEFTESLIDLAEGVILVLDHTGRIVRTNRYTCSLIGQALGELAGQPMTDLLVPEERPSAQELLSHLSAGTRTVHGVHRLRTKDGQTRTMVWSARALAAGADRRAWTLIVGNDITSLLDAQHRAVQAEKLAAIGETIAGLAHESRNALQRSQACIEILQFRLADQPEFLDLVNRVQNAQDDLHRLYEGVREYAAPVHLQLRSCNLAQIWREAWEDLRLVWTQRGAELREEIQVTDLRCEVSPFHLKQVFRNLLENALSATNQPVRIAIRCTVAELDGREIFQVAVGDNGPGFAAEHQARAFEPFFTTKLRGTGLGLAICKRLVEAHGGRIAVAHKDEPGALILVTLPRSAA